MTKHDAHMQAQILLRELKHIGMDATLYHAESAKTYYVDFYRYPDDLAAFPYDEEDCDA
jgi:hypothetical protein